MSTDRFSELQLTNNRFWKVFEDVSCNPLGPFCRRLGGISGPLRRVKERFGVSVNRPGTVVDAPWAPSGRIWRLLGGVYIPTVGFHGGGFRRSPVGPLGGLAFEARGSLIFNGFCDQFRWIRGCFFTDFS